MEKNLRLFLHFFLTLSQLLQLQAISQSQALSHFYKTKLTANISGIDVTHFPASPDVDYASKIHPQHGLKEKDRIQKLPGQPPVRFSQYGGYVTIDKSAGRALYYYFVEAQHSKDSMPLLLWLNGGPGCSSLAYGAMQELGPFRIYSDGNSLYPNPYSWNNAANVLFVESPAGVGFSYSNRSWDYHNRGDRNTAQDNYIFLLNWLERFPEFKGREFYISGESYAGHYVPELAHTILYHNTTIINLKGILIGNAVINDETDTVGMYDYLATHALISNKLANKLKAACTFSPSLASNSDDCSAASDEAGLDTAFINIYNIYAPSCFQNGTTSKPNKPSVLEFDPCTDFYVHKYLNRADVQEALHANVTKLAYEWKACSTVLRNWSDSPSTMIPLLRQFMADGLRVWIFSGDTDGRVPVTSTQYSISAMKLAVKTEWHPWYIAGEVGGYTEIYEGGLTFATVRGAGHQVPSYQPLRALSLIFHFLHGSPLPDTATHS